MRGKTDARSSLYIQRNLWSSGAIFKRMGAIHSRIVSIFHRWKGELYTIHSVTAHGPLGKAVTPAWRKEKRERERECKIQEQAPKRSIEFFRGGKQMDQSSIDTHREDYEHTGITEKHTCLQKHTSQDYASTLCYIHHGFLGKAEGISSNNDIMPRPNVIFPLPPLSVMQQHEQITHGSHDWARNANAGFI